MDGRVKNYYAEGNTARGFHNLYESALQELDNLFILKGEPATGKSSLIKKVGEELLHSGYDIEFLHSSRDNESVDGVIIPIKKIAVIDGTHPHIIELKNLGVAAEYIDLGLACDSEKLSPYKSKIDELNTKISQSYDKAYSLFAEALKIHDEWEKIYISNINFEELSKLSEELIKMFLSNKILHKNSKVHNRFLGAATPNGPVDFVQNLTENINKRYFIKGRAGSGKSTLLKKLGTAAIERGFDVEIYHCGFDPNSLDMVILPELSIAIFDSTSPHEYFPNRDTDEIIDIYTRAITAGTDEKYSGELKDVTSRYSSTVKEATSYLAEGKNLYDELKDIYKQAIDYKLVDDIGSKLLNKILDIVK